MGPISAALVRSHAFLEPKNRGWVKESRAEPGWIRMSWPPNHSGSRDPPVLWPGAKTAKKLAEWATRSWEEKKLKRRVPSSCNSPARNGHGSKFKHQGIAGVSPCFHLPVFDFPICDPHPNEQSPKFPDLHRPSPSSFWFSRLAVELTFLGRQLQLEIEVPPGKKAGTLPPTAPDGSI